MHCAYRSALTGGGGAAEGGALSELMPAAPRSGLDTEVSRFPASFFASASAASLSRIESEISAMFAVKVSMFAFAWSMSPLKSEMFPWAPATPSRKVKSSPSSKVPEPSRLRSSCVVSPSSSFWSTFCPVASIARVARISPFTARVVSTGGVAAATLPGEPAWVPLGTPTPVSAAASSRKAPSPPALASVSVPRMSCPASSSRRRPPADSGSSSASSPSSSERERRFTPRELRLLEATPTRTS
mmetsp:Transcript_13591/g.28944  ORF Transcript_13591/g.28944 Transcript_13591/m.28944 type:complete len:243 (+) Transcript_13591:3696-4424(+)